MSQKFFLLNKVISFILITNSFKFIYISDHLKVMVLSMKNQVETIFWVTLLTGILGWVKEKNNEKITIFIFR